LDKKDHIKKSNFVRKNGDAKQKEGMEGHWENYRQEDAEQRDLKKRAGGCTYSVGKRESRNGS